MIWIIQVGDDLFKLKADNYTEVLKICEEVCGSDFSIWEYSDIPDLISE